MQDSLTITLAIYLSIGWLIPIFACIIIGREKNRNGFAWGFFLGIIGLIVLAILSPLEEKISTHISSYKQEHKPGEDRCPHCAGYYDFAFNKCPHCGKDRSNLPQILFLSKQIESNTFNIKCPNCNRVISIIGKPNTFVKYTCTFCNFKINEKNVLFTDE